MSNDQLTHASANGKLLKEIITKHQLSVMNFTGKCQGYWTHVIRTTDEKSVLDYVITDKVREDAVSNIIIDEDCLLCPFWVKKGKGGSSPQYSDHNAVIMEMEFEARENKSRETEYFWKN